MFWNFQVTTFPWMAKQSLFNIHVPVPGLDQSPYYSKTMFTIHFHVLRFIVLDLAIDKTIEGNGRRCSRIAPVANSKERWRDWNLNIYHFSKSLSWTIAQKHTKARKSSRKHGRTVSPFELVTQNFPEVQFIQRRIFLQILLFDSELHQFWDKVLLLLSPQRLCRGNLCFGYRRRVVLDGRWKEFKCTWYSIN